MGFLKLVNQQSEGNTFYVVILTQVADVFREPIASSSGLGILVGQIIDESIYSIISRRFQISQPFYQRAATQPLAEKSDFEEVTQMERLLAGVSRIEARQEEMLKRLAALEKVIADKMPERAQVQTQGQVLREVKVLSAKMQRSIGRISGDVCSEEQTFLQSLLPMSSEETVLKVEECLTNKAHADAMSAIIFRPLFTDELAWEYNCYGGLGKKSFISLKVVDMVLGAFASIHSDKILAVRHYVLLSRNRFKHVRRKKNMGLNC
ncbi:uncharacterized protein [Eurosta solidaginis]|uniref:uncharacterized protein n=1 Tax=Eurosta solidaginis TaxID=178769 RepID=UPI003530FDB4